ncbi:polyphosphate--glucose phosphotransferase [Corynebacterium meridianum]|uniref:ROK family protein n=1 Tax=Corynebacterium meridianum TaxID=2765363 RepID=A0A934M8E8_9CORY|nr:ROK family protein [Corynebacterium meridianum]MBI8989045.1 ROK family protein [Corynebacterium meridianum]MCK7676691.1 ROK family protein [Corynebacterium meridianum]
MTNIGFGIDVGGSGIKGARVNLDTGEFIDDRIKIPTPQPATPGAVAATVEEIVRLADWDGPVGITLPSVIRNQRALTAANIDPSWVDTDVNSLFHETLGHRRISVLNDADAAGLAEVSFGNPEARSGSVILLTFGTGIGSAFLMDGELFPNTELGHLLVDGVEAEHLASSAVKEREDLRYGQWARERVSPVLREFERLFWPSLFIVGGGISRKAHKWVPKLECSTRVVPAELRNRAGIVGAAMAVDRDLTP